MKSLKIILLIISLTIVCLSSADAAAVEWHLRSPITFFGVTFGKNIFVAVGEKGTVVTSPDGRTWILAQSGTKESLRAVIYGNDTFMAVGDKGTI